VKMSPTAVNVCGQHCVIVVHLTTGSAKSITSQAYGAGGHCIYSSIVDGTQSHTSVSLMHD
jgi:hypothetical protein